MFKKMKKRILLVLFLLPAITVIDAQNILAPILSLNNTNGRFMAAPAPAHPQRVSGTTQTAPVTGYLTEDFEGSFPPPGWQVVDVLDPTYTWAPSTVFPYTGTSSALIFFSGVGVSAEDWMITPQYSVTSTDSLSFHLACVDVNYPPDTTFILVSTTDSNLTSFTETVAVLAEDLNYPPNDTEYYYYSYSLAAFAGQNIYIAFKNINIFGDGVYIDHVAIGTKPPDAAAASIDVPKFAPVGTFSPLATFKNDGDSIISFPVTMTISGGYSSNKNITNLAPGATQQVTFDPYNASAPGSRVVSIQTFLTGDTHLSNDTLTSGALFMESFTNYGWSTRAPLAIARQGAAVSSINNNTSSTMYVSGGYRPSIVTDSTDEFMPLNNSWAPTSAVGKMVKAVYMAGAANVKNTIYVAGGYNLGTTPIGNTQVYDPGMNTWGNGFSMSSPVGDYAIGVFNDSIIYYIGGYSGSLYRNLVQLFVPSGFLWIPGNTLPIGVAGCRGGIIGNKIVVTGGNTAFSTLSGATFLGDIDPANPYIITWQQVTDYPSGPITRLAGGASLDAASGLVLFTGGNESGIGNAPVNYTFAYDVNVNQWKVGPPKPTPAYNLCNFTPVVDNDSLYMVAVGGYGPGGALDANEWLNMGPYQVVVGVNENNNVNVNLTCSPNPFNDLTNIRFALNKKATVKAAVVDVLGNEVEVLSNAQMSPGNINLIWNASAYASGVYFCRLTVDGKTTTEKLIKY